MREGNTGVVIAAAVLIVLLLILFGGGLMGWGMMGPGHMRWWDGNGLWSWWGVGMMLVMMLFWFAFIVAIVAGIVWLMRQGTSNGTGGGVRRDRANDILRERYARGEIDREEFERMRKELGQ
jgi:putative membrane protein